MPIIDTLEKKYVHSKVFQIHVDHAIQEGERNRDRLIFTEQLKQLDAFLKTTDLDPKKFFGPRGITTSISSSKEAESRIKVVEKWIAEKGYSGQWEDYKKNNPLNGH